MAEVAAELQLRRGGRWKLTREDESRSTISSEALQIYLIPAPLNSNPEPFHLKALWSSDREKTRVGGGTVEKEGRSSRPSIRSVSHSPQLFQQRE
ncbi:hypothetical protein ACFX15_013691 [Malus domestica]